MSGVRKTATFAFAMYLGASLFAGLLVQRAIPPLNTLGVAVVGLTWPRQLQCARVSSNCDPMPPAWLGPYIFTFSREPKP
jgi:hypothetical protein